MRAALAAAVVALLGAATAHAQDALGVGRVPGITFTRPPAPAPPPPSGRPAPPPIFPGGGHALPPGHQFERDLFRAGPKTYAPRFDRRSHVGFPTFVPPFPYFAFPTYGTPYVIVEESVPYFSPVVVPGMQGFGMPDDARRGTLGEPEPRIAEPAPAP